MNKLVCNKIDILDSNHEIITLFNCVLHTKSRDVPDHIALPLMVPFF